MTRKRTHKKKITRKGSGRTKGSYSFVRVSWKQLKDYVNDSTHVLISRKWAENVGIFYATSAPVNVLSRSRLTK